MGLEMLIVLQRKAMLRSGYVPEGGYGYWCAPAPHQQQSPWKCSCTVEQARFVHNYMLNDMNSGICYNRCVPQCS